MTTQTIEIPVKGMDCASCVKHVQEAIEGLPGVSSASVLLSSEKAIVQLDPKQVDIPAIAKAVAAAGYSVPEAVTGAPSPARTFGDVSRPVLTIFGILLLICAGNTDCYACLDWGSCQAWPAYQGREISGSAGPHRYRAG